MFIVSTLKQYDTCDTFLGEEILFAETNSKSFKDFTDALKYMHQQANELKNNFKTENKGVKQGKLYDELGIKIYSDAKQDKVIMRYRDVDDNEYKLIPLKKVELDNKKNKQEKDLQK